MIRVPLPLERTLDNKKCVSRFYTVLGPKGRGLENAVTVQNFSNMMHGTNLRETDEDVVVDGVSQLFVMSSYCSPSIAPEQPWLVDNHRM